MTLLSNQFAMVPVQGDLDLQIESSVISVAIDSTQGTALVAGAAVKLVDGLSPIPTVVGLAANSDTAFGFIIRTLKDQNFPAFARAEIAMAGSVMQMTTSGAIARGAKVEYVVSSTTVITSAGTNPVVGLALDKATASGQIIRILVLEPNVAGSVTIAGVGGLQTALNARPQVVSGVATLAQINAGLVLIPGVAGQAITVNDFVLRVTGNWATATSVEIESTNVTPVGVVTETIAGLTTGAIIMPAVSDTHQTLGAGFAAALGSGDGLQIVNVGTAGTGGTSIAYNITFQQQ